VAFLCWRGTALDDYFLRPSRPQGPRHGPDSDQGQGNKPLEHGNLLEGETERLHSLDETYACAQYRPPCTFGIALSFALLSVVACASRRSGSRRPQSPGIGFEYKSELRRVLANELAVQIENAPMPSDKAESLSPTFRVPRSAPPRSGDVASYWNDWYGKTACNPDGSASLAQDLAKELNLTMNLEFKMLEGRFVLLQPFEEHLKNEVRAAIDCDPETWAIMPINPMGKGFEEYWSIACGASTDERFAYAIRRRSHGQIIGMSSYYTSLASQGGVEIGTSFLRPDERGGPVNPEVKFLMLDHAFTSGASRVQFRVDTRNKRSQAAIAKLGAVREGVLRRDRLTWTGYIRDTVYYSILREEWPGAKLRLEERLAKFR